MCTLAKTLTAVAALASWFAADAETVAITNVTVVDGNADAGRAGLTVVIEGERIAAVGPARDVRVPPGATVVDGTGKFLMPGLADLHNHVVPPVPTPVEADLAALSGLLSWGITTVFSPGMDLDALKVMKQAAAKEPAHYPRYFSAGHVLVIGEGFDFPRASWSKPTTPAAARAEVRAMQAAGADMIKFLIPDISTSPLRPEIYAAIVEEAHRLKLKAVAHAPQLVAAHAALRAGADGLLHGIYDRPVDEELIGLMRRNAAFYISTSVLFDLVADPARWRTRARAFEDTDRVPGAAFELLESPDLLQAVESTKGTGFGSDDIATLQSNLRALHGAGIPVVVGTDTPVLGLIPGLATLLEMQSYVDAGISAIDTIRAATVNAQRALGRESQSGTVEAGKLAELILLYADPSADIANVRRIKAVIQAGVYVDVQ
jgi:imidazolonepropionase-like amidohydrolase